MFRHAVPALLSLSVPFAVAAEPAKLSYSKDIAPILNANCAGCHRAGEMAPMSLMTYEDTVPWGESIRVELLAGHMPPWSVDAAPARFRNVRPLSARDINVLLTWSTGGTPLGDPAKTPQPVAVERRWPLGTPDLSLERPKPRALECSRRSCLATTCG